jgi:hypothetical protein
MKVMIFMVEVSHSGFDNNNNNDDDGLLTDP